MMQRWVIIIGVFIFMAQNLMSQVLNPVKWSYSVENIGNGQFNLKFKAVIDQNWHLYSQHIPEGGPIPTSFHFEPNTNYEMVGKTVELSKAIMKHDESFGIDLSLFSDEALFVQKIKSKSSAKFDVNGTIEFMSCDDHRCLPPKNIDFVFQIPASSVSKATIKKTEIISDSVKRTDSALITNIPKNDSIVSVASTPTKEDKGMTGSVWGFIIYAFLWGLAGVLTPCVYPMIPMTVSFFMRDEKKQSKGIMKGLFFGVSIVGIYTLIGLLVSLSIIGSDFGNVLSSHWIPNLLFFLMFFVFALSFFGMFEIVLPSSMVNSIDRNAEKGGIVSIFFMALTLIVVSFSCTGPIVGKILIEASQGIAARPIAGMFGYSLAFALPFTLFALFPSLLKTLPKSGGWLNSVKVVMAFVLLAFSLKFLLAIDTTHHLNILTREVYLSIWIVLSFLLGFYLLGKIKFSHDSDLTHLGVPRLILVIAVFSFGVYLIPGLFGAPLNAVSSLLPPANEKSLGFNALSSTSNQSNICETPKYSDFLHLPNGLQGYFEYKQGLECARKLNKPVFIDIKGHTCTNCKVMEATVFSDSKVLEKLSKDFVIVALYVDDATKLVESDWVKSKKEDKVNKTMGAVNLDYEISTFDTNTQPLYAILNVDGKPLNSPMEFTRNVNVFLKFLDDGKKKFLEK